MHLILVFVRIFCAFLLVVGISFWATLFATEVQSESKWKQLGELAMSNGKVQLSGLSFILHAQCHSLHCHMLMSSYFFYKRCLFSMN
jgi:hypothetical protein